MKNKKGDGSVFQRGAIYWIKYYRNGKPYRETSGSEKESEARKLLKKRNGEIVLGRFIGPEAERVTIRELAEDYLNDYRVNGRKSLDKAARMIKRHDAGGIENDSVLMAYFGDCKAHSIGADAIKKYISQRLEAGAANATVNRELAPPQAHVQPWHTGGEDLQKALYPDARRGQRANGIFRAW
jgi:hypothetical protein